MSLTKLITLLQETMVPVIAAVVILSFGIITPAHGQGAYEGMATQETVHISDTRLRLFIDAQNAVESVQQRYIKAAQDPGGEYAEILQRSMGEEIVRTIEAFGMSVDEYNTILAEIQKTDSDSARRYHDMTRTE